MAYLHINITIIQKFDKTNTFNFEVFFYFKLKQNVIAQYMLTEIQGNFQKNKFMCQPHYMIYNTNNFMDNFLTFNADTIVGITPTIISGIMTFFYN